MSHSLLSSFREFFEGNPSVRKVADDPALSAEILLLFRMILADGKVSDAELATLNRICRESFGIPESDMPKVINYLKDFGYETSGRQAAETFQAMSPERKKALMDNMIAIAKADDELVAQEVKLAKSIAAVLKAGEA